MKPRLRAPSPSFVISLVALTLALGGGAAAPAAIQNLRGQPGPTGNAYSVQETSWVALPDPWG
jgi:hypothetical protein